MRKISVIICCFALGGILTGCSLFKPESKNITDDGMNLTISIKLFKNNKYIDKISSVISHKYLSIDSKCIEGDNKNKKITINFRGDHFKKLAPGIYSMSYNIGLYVPYYMYDGKGNITGSSTQRIGSASLINLKLNKPVYIFENKTYKVEITITGSKQNQAINR